MSFITFKLSEVKPLVSALQNADTLNIDWDDLYNVKLHKNGIVIDKFGRTQEEAEAQGDFFEPNRDNIDKTLLQKKLILVGDDGIYLITNAKLDESPAKLGLVAYANGCNPKIDANFYEKKRALFGSSDGCVPFPLEWVERAIAANRRTLKLKLTKDSISLVL